MGNEQKQYIHLITTLIKIRNSVKGFDSSITININDIDTGLIKDKEKLFEMLNNFKTDKILIDYERETIIRDYKINADDNNNITIYGSSIRKLELYAKNIMNNGTGLTKKYIKPLTLPPETIWEDITIKFKNKYEIEIYVKDKFLEIASNENMGCYKSNLNKEEDNSDKQWEFLQKLSVSNGNFDLNSLTNIKEKDSYKKYKEKLSDNLVVFFNIKEDPFYDYKEKDSYQTKFKIEPNPGLRHNGEILLECKDDIYDYVEEETNTDRISHKMKSNNPEY